MFFPDHYDRILMILIMRLQREHKKQNAKKKKLQMNKNP